MKEFLNTKKIGSGNKTIVFHFPAQTEFDAFYDGVIGSFEKRLNFDTRIQAACRYCTMLFTRQPIFEGYATLRIEFINAEVGIYAYPHGYEHLIAKRIATDTGLKLYRLKETPPTRESDIQIGIAPDNAMQEHALILVKQAIFRFPEIL